MNGLLGKYFGLSVSLLWILTTNSNDFGRNWTSELKWLVSIPFALIPYAIASDLQSSIFRHYGTYYYFLIGILFYHYYCFVREEYAFLGKVAFVSIVFSTLGAIQTIVGLSAYPKASRLLATSSLDMDIRLLYERAGIGGFGYVYSSCFLVISIFYLVIKYRIEFSKITYTFLILALILHVVMLLNASYAIAIFIMIIGLVMTLMVEKRILRFGAFFMLLLFLVISQGEWSKLLLYFARLFENNKIIYTKINDLMRTLTGNLTSGTSTAGRFALYRGSLETFLQYPFFGASGPFGDKASYIGKHSGWLDLLGRYGLFLSLPLIGTLYTYLRKVFILARGKSAVTFSVQPFLLFFLFGFLNPVFPNYQLGLAVLFIIPSLHYLPHASKAERPNTLNVWSVDRLPQWRNISTEI